MEWKNVQTATNSKRYLHGWKIILTFVAEIVSRPGIYIPRLGTYISRPETTNESNQKGIYH